MSKNIVVLGAGFGGLRCALELARALVRDYSLRSGSAQNDGGGWNIVLVDRNLYHIYFPRLYELAVPHNGKLCTISIPKILKGSRVEFIHREIKGIDCKKKAITLADSKVLSFEYLVLALGAGTDYFGIEGLEEYACTLKSVEDAACIREKVKNFLQKIRHPEEPQGDEGSRTNQNGILRAAQNDSNRIEIMIGGAGATGVEVAAELAYLFRKVPREHWSITLIEALSSVLWMFPPAVGSYASKRLTKLGVHVMLDTCIKRVEQGKQGVEVVLAPRPLKPGESEAALVCDFLPEREKQISADLLLWAGGVRATPLLSRCALPVDRKGRMDVDEYLRVKNFDNVFAIGDDATLVNPKDQKPVPATAQAAIEQGRLVAGNIVRLIKTGGLASGVPEARPLVSYKFHDFPAIIPLGGHDGVAYVGGRVFIGFFSWFLRKAADCRYLASILGWWMAMKRCIIK